MKGSTFIFDCVNLLYYKYHKINPNLVGSYTDSPDWIKSKKSIINPINKKCNKCFQQLVSPTLNHKEIKKDPHRITRMKSFADKYSWKERNFSTENND